MAERNSIAPQSDNLNFLSDYIKNVYIISFVVYFNPIDEAMINKDGALVYSVYY
jgi:hypothetical protein